MYRFTIPRPPAENEELAAARQACLAAIANPNYLRPPQVIDAPRRLREMQEAAARAPAEFRRKLSEMSR